MRDPTHPEHPDPVREPLWPDPLRDPPHPENPDRNEALGSHSRLGVWAA